MDGELRKIDDKWNICKDGAVPLTIEPIDDPENPNDGPKKRGEKGYFYDTSSERSLGTINAGTVNLGEKTEVWIDRAATLDEGTKAVFHLNAGTLNKTSLITEEKQVAVGMEEAKSQIGMIDVSSYYPGLKVTPEEYNNLSRMLSSGQGVGDEIERLFQKRREEAQSRVIYETQTVCVRDAQGNLASETEALTGDEKKAFLEDVFDSALLKAEYSETEGEGGTKTGTITITSRDIETFIDKYPSEHNGEDLSEREKEQLVTMDQNRQFGNDHYDAIYNEDDPRKVLTTLRNIARCNGYENIATMTNQLGNPTCLPWPSPRRPSTMTGFTTPARRSASEPPPSNRA